MINDSIDMDNVTISHGGHPEEEIVDHNITINEVEDETLDDTVITASDKESSIPEADPVQQTDRIQEQELRRNERTRQQPKWFADY